MRQVVAYLAVLIVLAFALLYYSGHTSNHVFLVIGILVLLLGMPGPIIKRMRLS